MYLVATAINLAPCAVGAENADLFAAAIGTDYYAESSVARLRQKNNDEYSLKPLLSKIYTPNVKN